MSLQQWTGDRRQVIDLTNGPVIDLTRASYFAPEDGALEEAANRLLMASYTQRRTPATTGHSHLPKARARRIDVVGVLVVTTIAAACLLLLGIAASAQ